VINTATNTVTANVPVGFNSHGIAITPDGKTVYVVSNDYENKNGIVSVINTTTNAVTKTVSVGSHPMGIAASPDGTKMYVTNVWDWTVSVIDTATNTVIETVEVGIMPLGVAITPDGTRVYVANEWDWTVSVIDTETNLVIKTVKLPLRSTTPIIKWRKPVDIIHGTALSDIQLNAVATDPYTGNEVNGTPVYTPVKGTKLGPGMHTLRIDFIPEDTSAYNKVSKTVTISVKSIPEIRWSNPENITYGTALSNTQLNATSTDPVTGNRVDGTYFYTLANVTKIVSGITVLSTGVHTLHVDFTPKDTATYTNGSKNVTINVTKSPLKVKWDEPDAIIYGKALGSTQLNVVVTDPYTGNKVPGIHVYDPPSGTILDGGTHPLNFSFIPKDTANYTKVSKSITINVIPHVEFSADVILGPPPLTVQFTDKSTGNPTEWEWNFGDGVTSSDRNPEHKYRKAGTYTVKETVINSAGKNKKIKENYINVTTDNP
jgi:YVTN family beta-propeller protein